MNGCNEPYYSSIKKYIESLQMQSPCIELVQTSTPGVSNARNLGLEKAKGDYISFLDDDDYVSDSYLEELLRISQPNNVGISNTLAFYNEEEAFKYHLSFVYDRLCGQKKLPYYTSKEFFSGPCMKLIHREVIRQRRFDCDLRNGEDTLFMFMISDSLGTVSFTKSSAIYYRRIRPNSAVTRRRSLKEIAGASFLQLKKYVLIYLTNPKSYRFTFFITRVGGCIVFLLKSCFRALGRDR